MHTISIKKLKSTVPGHLMVEYGDDFFVKELEYPQGKDFTLMYPCRFDGSVSIYVLEGELSLCVGLDEYTAVKDSFAISLPGDIIRLERRKGYDGPVRMHLMAISGELLSEPEFEMQGLSSALTYRMIHAEGPYLSMIKHFREIIADLTQYPHDETGRSFRCLITAMCIEIRHAWENYATTPVVGFGTSNHLVKTFLSMVTKDRCRHRDIAYFAQKMNLTAKYLSAAVKTASGKTAIEWINDAVILEAKNLLKYTTMPIKEIAFSLNFDSQMNFYRFFSRHAGLSPSDYRAIE